MKTLNEYLIEAELNHGHMCPGQVLGVRMAITGCNAVGITEPKCSKRLIVFVEIDRCAADAITTVTGCRLGKRTLKYRDFGKLAATFLNTETGEAIRVAALESSRELARQLFAQLSTKKEQQLAAYKTLSDRFLFRCERVQISLPEADRPGHPLARVACDRCGEGINDGREVREANSVRCRACAGATYYQVIEQINLDQVDATRTAAALVETPQPCVEHHALANSSPERLCGAQNGI
ncbi:MAG: formylmethanofuran dehydrogenase subunit E family protein [Acidobacteria bacterium]|nr:formylmethanofuran dehydrogenase subunit E family protein [Acidobacteriota bacterium]